MNILTLTHPEYDQFEFDWLKWRLAYEGGRQFIESYLEKFSSREEELDFLKRKRITYCPAFAKSAINDIKNSIYQRLVDITRVGGSPSFQDAVKNDVDLFGSSMNFFMGTKVLPELLVMKKVGIYVDMPQINEIINLNKEYQYRPYLYLYRTEDIRCWKYDEYPTQNQYSSLLLRECVYKEDPETGLPNGTMEIHKLFKLIDNKVYVKIYSNNGEIFEETFLNINRIPFVPLCLPHSLMKDIADYQIALLNLSSADISYLLKANFPFYTEQFDPRAESPHLKSNEDKTKVEIGPTSGRKYPINTERPSFIHPSSEPLLASIKKQEQLVQEIRLLVNLSVANLIPKMASAESKGFDQQSLEAGLSAIGLELENAEKQIAQIWSLYENYGEVATVKYPEKYNLKSDSERRSDCEQLDKLIDTVPSKTFQKEVAKSISDILLRNRVSDRTLEQINKEIERASVVNVDPNVILNSVEKGLISEETASLSLGYPIGEVEKAKKDHAERLARIVISQTEGAAAARGISDLSSNQGNGSAEKQIVQQKEQDPVVTSKIRGRGK